MGIQLSEAARRLVDGKNYAVLATVNPDGSPQTSVVWVGRDDGDLLTKKIHTSCSAAADLCGDALG
jgi:hypothetical protein